MEVFSNIPREDLKRACSRFRSRLEKFFDAKGDFSCKMYSPNINKQFLKISSIYCYFEYFMKVYICFKKRASLPLASCISKLVGVLFDD
jgi:hypothetical protein